MVVIGCPWDFFGKASLLKTEANTNWQRIVKLSRKPQYYEKIMNLYSDGKTESPIAWCTFLVGNSSIDRRAFESTGGFDPGFTDWGFEHFEFAYRLKKQDFMFYSCPQAESFHLPHPRQSGFYQSMIHSSMKYFMQLHPKVPVNALERFLLGEISLQDFEKSFCVNLSYGLPSNTPNPRSPCSSYGYLPYPPNRSQSQTYCSGYRLNRALSRLSPSQYCGPRR